MWNLGRQSPPFGLEDGFQEDREIVLFKTLSWYLAYYSHLNDQNEWMNEWLVYLMVQDHSQNILNVQYH